MNKFDRGFIKWQPFESLGPSKQVINSLVREKSKIPKPVLSEDETSNLEAKIIEAYYSKEKVILSYYQSGFIQKVQGQIIKIDHVYKMIYLNSNLKLLFSQIIAIVVPSSLG